MRDSDAVVRRQRALENAAGDALPDVLEAFERGHEDGMGRRSRMRFGASPFLRDLKASYENGFALAEIGFGGSFAR